MITPIHDFDEDKTIIGYQIDHAPLGVNGVIITTENCSVVEAYSKAKAFLASFGRAS